MARIVIFGLPYSPNVGDGVIAECLRAGLADAAPDSEVTCIDISGRNDFGQITVKRRSLALAVLRALPRAIAQRLVLIRLGRMLDGFEPRWRAAVDGADLAIIGGGQIFSDADLNFCIKINRVARILDAAACPVVVHAAGVARNWSPRGRTLFRALLSCDLRAVGLRDRPSIRNWQDQMGQGGPSPVLTRDPALIAAQVYAPGSVAEDSRIGLCVTDPAILAYHAENGKTAVSHADIFARIALALVARGASVTLFCNGASEDRAALSAVQAHPEVAAAIAQGTIDAAPPPDTPAALAGTIAGLRAVIAHRLHACILAYAFQRPIIGLGWDRKLESFFESVGLEEYFLPSQALTAEKVAQLAEAAMHAGIDPSRHAAVVAETRATIRGILTAI